MRISYFTKLTGTSFRQDTIAKLNGKSRLKLVARPDNEYDEFAVECLAQTNDGWESIGWIAKGKNQDLSRVLQAGEDVQICLQEVTGGSESAPTLGVNVSIIYGNDDAVDVSKMAKVKVQYGDDSFIYFDEENHEAYDVNGNRLLSGSRLEDQYQQKDGLEYAAKALSAKTGVFTEDLRGLWEAKGEIAASYGTLIHRAIELAYKWFPTIYDLDSNLEEEQNYLRLAPPVIGEILNKYFKFREENDPHHYTKVETEVRVKYGKFTGIIDNLCIDEDNKTFFICDYKVIQKLKDVKYGNKKMKKYTLQQNLYRYIMEQAGYQCLGMYLHIWDGTAWKQEELEVVDILEYV